MYPLVETIRIQKGVPQNLEWHQQRFERSCRTLFGKSSGFLLKTEIKVPPAYRGGIVKCRFLYNNNSYKTEFQKYLNPRIRSLKLVEGNSIEYSLKYTDRTSIKNLLKTKGQFDDILIIKNGYITDSSIANIVFFDGEKWITPDSPLLRGTAREKLLNESKISTGSIRVEDLKRFSHFRLINAMVEFDQQEMIGNSWII